MKSPRLMDDAELAFQRRDLKEAILALESLPFTGKVHPKLSQYLDEQHEVLEEIRRRAHGSKTMAYAGKRLKNPGYDDPRYKYFLVLDDGWIHSGWATRRDASAFAKSNHMSEYSAVVARRAMPDDLNPQYDRNWAVTRYF